MNVRHAAALALTGWYLMAYVPGSHWDKPIGWKPPLSQWQIMGSYDSAQACKEDWASQVHSLRGQKVSTFSMLKASWMPNASRATILASRATSAPANR
jgi:hypothetical protein